MDDQLQINLTIPGEIHTVEELNPRGRVVREGRSAIRRGRELSRICRLVLDTAGTPEEARLVGPWGWGVAASSKLKDVFGPIHERHQWAAHWAWIFDHWYTGALERVERVAVLNLPAATRKEL